MSKKLYNYINLPVDKLLNSRDFKDSLAKVLCCTNVGGGIQSVVAGTNITVDNTDPNNPIINATGGGIGGQRFGAEGEDTSDINYREFTLTDNRFDEFYYETDSPIELNIIKANDSFSVQDIDTANTTVGDLRIRSDYARLRWDGDGTRAQVILQSDNNGDASTWIQGEIITLSNAAGTVYSQTTGSLANKQVMLLDTLDGYLTRYTGTFLSSVQAGTNVTIDNTDPNNPIISASGGSATPAGSNTQIQYNNSGAFGASSNFTYSSSVGLAVTASGAYTTLVLNDSGNAPAAIWSFAGTPGFGIFGIPSAGQIVSNSQTLDSVYRNLYGNVLIGKGAGDAVLSVSDTYVGIGTRIANTSSILDVTSTSKGFLKPRMTTTQKNAISSPATGLEIYDTTLGITSYYDGSSWKTILKGYTEGSSTGNTAVGDNAANGSVSGFNNTAGGYQALNILSSGSDNTAFGSGAGRSITTSAGNSLFGRNTGRLITGQNNSAFGTTSLYSTTTGQNNSAFGYQALYLNDVGQYNNAFGTLSLYSNTSGRYGVAMGDQALFNNTTGWYNTGVGSSALYNLTGVAQYSTGIGYQAGMNLTTGANCIAIGANTIFASATADNQLNIGNIIFGTGLGTSITPPTGNIGIGDTAPSTRLSVVGTTKTTNFYTNSATPTATLGAGAGSGSPSVTFTTGSTNQAGVITLVTGTTPIANSNLFNLTFSNSFTAPNGSVMVLTPINPASSNIVGNGSSSLLTDGYTGPKTLVSVLTNTIAPTASTTYIFGYQIMHF